MAQERSLFATSVAAFAAEHSSVVGTDGFPPFAVAYSQPLRYGGQPCQPLNSSSAFARSRSATALGLTGPSAARPFAQFRHFVRKVRFALIVQRPSILAKCALSLRCHLSGILAFLLPFWGRSP